MDGAARPPAHLFAAEVFVLLDNRSINDVRMIMENIPAEFVGQRLITLIAMQDCRQDKLLAAHLLYCQTVRFLVKLFVYS